MKKGVKILFIIFFIVLIGGLLFKLNVIFLKPQIQPILDFKVSSDPLKKEASYQLNISNSGQIYYFSSKGNDRTDTGNENNGLTPLTPFKSLAKISSLKLSPGDQIRLRCGDIFTDGITLSSSGNITHPIIITSYNDGEAAPQKPIIQGNSIAVTGIYICGNYSSIIDIQIQGWQAGIITNKNTAFCNISWNFITKNCIGISLKTGYHHFVGYNLIQDNDKMIPFRLGNNDDYGAQGIMIDSNQSEIAFNYITGHIAGSSDYLIDGAAIEMNGGSYNYIHHNFAVGNTIFTEIGKPSSISQCISNLFYRNYIINQYSNIVLVQHTSGSFGPTYNITMEENFILYFSTPTKSYRPMFQLGAEIIDNPPYPYFTIKNNLIFTTFHPIGNDDIKFLSYFDANNGRFLGNSIYLWTINQWSTKLNQSRTDLLNKTGTLFPENRIYFYNSLESFHFDKINQFGFLWNDLHWDVILAHKIGYFA
jgi:hypothetical protein